MCDMWFTHPKDLKVHLKDVHSAEDDKSSEEVVIANSAAAAAAALAIATQSLDGAETVLLEDGIQVEHVTVEPVDVMEMEETATVVMEDGGVAEMCEEDMERLKQAGVQIQVVHVTTTEVDSQDSQVEVELDAEMMKVEETEQGVVVWECEMSSRTLWLHYPIADNLFSIKKHCMLDKWCHLNMSCCVPSH